VRQKSSQPEVERKVNYYHKIDKGMNVDELVILLQEVGFKRIEVYYHGCSRSLFNLKPKTLGEFLPLFIAIFYTKVSDGFFATFCNYCG
jgi:hypothetical protein